jgi:hypothetical protein
MKMRPVGAELFHEDKLDEANIRSPQFCQLACNIPLTFPTYKYLIEHRTCAF